MDELVIKAETAIQQQLDKKNLDEIHKELKELFPDKQIKSWMKHYISGVVYQNLSVSAIARHLNLSRGTIYKYIDDDIRKYIDELKEQQLMQYEQKTFNLIDKSIQVLEDLVDSADTDATRLRAAEHILKKFGIIKDKQEVEHSGSIDMPTINIISEKKSDS